MNFEAMRSYVISSYPGDGWKNRVMRMNQRQVVAIYFSLIRKEQERRKSITTLDYQISMYDIYEEVMSC